VCIFGVVWGDGNLSTEIAIWAVYLFASVFWYHT
jgi:hypothetical protein